MSNLLKFSKLNPETIGRDFEIKGWSKVLPSQEVKDHYFNFLKLAHEFFSKSLEENEKLKNKRGFVLPGFITYPGARDGYFIDTTYMFHAGLFEEEKDGPEGIASFRRHANVWPEFQEFKDSFMKLRDYMFNVSKNTLEAVEKYYGLSKGDLVNMVEDGWSVQRCMEYKAFHDESRIGSLVVGEHRDTSMLTITFAGSQPGLEIKNESGDWEAVCGESADLIIGVGGMLEHISNGNFKNMFHRVKYLEQTVNNPRVSTPFFSWPKPECILEPHPAILKKHNQFPRYSSQLVIDHLEQNLVVPFSHEEDKGKIANYYKKSHKVA